MKKSSNPMRELEKKNQQLKLIVDRLPLIKKPLNLINWLEKKKPRRVSIKR